MTSADSRATSREAGAMSYDVSLTNDVVRLVTNDAPAAATGHATHADYATTSGIANNRTVTNRAKRLDDGVNKSTPKKITTATTTTKFMRQM